MYTGHWDGRANGSHLPQWWVKLPSFQPLTLLKRTATHYKPFHNTLKGQSLFTSTSLVPRLLLKKKKKKKDKPWVSLVCPHLAGAFRRKDSIGPCPLHPYVLRCRLLSKGPDNKDTDQQVIWWEWVVYGQWSQKQHKRMNQTFQSREFHVFPMGHLWQPVEMWQHICLPGQLCHKV